MASLQSRPGALAGGWSISTAGTPPVIAFEKSDGSYAAVAELFAAATDMAAAKNGANVNLTWTDTNASSAVYDVVRDGVVVATTGAGGTSSTISTETVGSHDYKVRPHVSGETSLYGAYSNTATLAFTITAPSAATSVWTDYGVATVDLAWTVNESGSATEVWRSIDGAAFTLIHTSAADAASYADTSAVAGSYVYKFRAKLGTEYSAYTAEIDALVLAVPAAPADLLVVNSATNTTTITWTTAAREDGYDQQAADNPEFSPEIAAGTLPAGTTSDVADWGEPYPIFYFRLRGTNVFGAGDWSTFGPIAVS